MALVRGQTKRLDIPGEPGEWVEIKKLPWGLLDAAREARTNAVIERAKQMGADLWGSIGAKASDAATAPADPLNEFDRNYLLHHAVQSWSYDAGLPDGVDDLDEDTAGWLAREIVSFNLKQRTEAERLDGTSPSTSP